MATLARLSDAELLARLVAFDSTSRNSNLPLADFLCNYLDRGAVRLRRNPSAEGDKVNLIFEVGPPAAAMGGERPGLVLSGHMDVVPADEEGWESDPFELIDRGNRYVGRGACDMKGFLAIAANLALEASERAAGSAAGGGPAGGRLAHPLALVFTYDEEVGTLGARRLAESCPEARELPASTVIGEPTELRVARAHKGHLRLRITLHGRSAHSGLPHLGQSAIEPAGAVVAALGELRRELEAEAAPHRELFPEVPFVPLNVGTIHGGSAVNVVPDRCVLELGLRPLPGADSRQLAERVERAARRAAAPLVPEIELLGDSPPMLVADDAPVLRALCALAGGEATTVSFATDAGWLQRLGMECILFGPGSISVAHRPNEFVPKADLAAARTVLERAIGQFCGAAP
jgi:acetylornithine deacetylase